MIAYALTGKRRTRDWILSRHRWRGDELVLDIGAGRGFLSVAAAKLVPRGRVIAIDIWRAEDLSGNKPASLTANAQAEAVADRIEVRTVDACAIDLADESIDVVISLLCIHITSSRPSSARKRYARSRAFSNLVVARLSLTTRVQRATPSLYATPD